MKEFKLVFNSPNELVAYFLENGISTSSTCKIELNSIDEWVDETNFDPSIENNKPNSPAATHRTTVCNDS